MTTERADDPLAHCDEAARLFAAQVRALLPETLEDYEHRRDEVLEAFPLPPLDAPSIPPPGPDFRRYADELAGGAPETPPLKGLRGKERERAAAAAAEAEAAFAPRRRRALEFAYVRALYEPGAVLPATLARRPGAAVHVSGGTLGESATYGPPRHTQAGRPPRVMVVGRAVGPAEEQRLVPIAGATWEGLARALESCGLGPDDVESWYFTNLVKHRGGPGEKEIPAAVRDNALPLLHCELAVFRPDFVLCLGLDAMRAVCATRAKADHLKGRVLRRSLDVGAPGAPEVFALRASLVLHPAQAARRPEHAPELADGLGAFLALVGGRRARRAAVRHTCVSTPRQLARAVDEVLADAPRGAGQPVAVDCEWHGRRPGEPGAYLRTVQFAHREGRGWCVVLRHAGGRPAFRGGDAAAVPHLLRLLKSTPDREVRVGGHYLRADLPWLLALGVDCRDEYAPPESPEATRDHGGWDTLTMTHAVMEAVEGGYKLETLAARLCGVPRYDLELQAWKERYCAERKLKDRELDGYGRCPADVLHPYSIWDVDATIRLFDRLNGKGGEPGLLDRDGFGNSSREAFWSRHRAALAALEMEMTGVAVDRARGDRLVDAFAAALDARTAELRDLIGWPTFNPNSAEQVRDWLYGSALNGKRAADGGRVRLRPRGVAALGLTPIKASGDAKLTWERVVAEGKEALVNPSTDRETLGIFSHDKEPATLAGAAGPTTRGAAVGKLRDVRFLAQVLKGNLKRPYEMGGELVLDPDENYTYDGGLLYWAGHDGRVRTHFGLVETGRWSSWLPNLQNISKRREEDYQRILAAGYLYPIRSILRAAPGHVLIEADYKMAEMAIIGMLAGDATMLEMVRRNTLDESDPDFIDLHSLTAIEAFRLDTPENRAIAGAKGLAWAATKGVLKALGRTALRVAAKNVNFGVPYQRSAEAIARQCHEEGADVSIEDAQRLIDAYYARYPAIAAYLEAAKLRVEDPGWMMDAFGGLRRFYPTRDRMVLAEMQRQACNFGIQATVAQCINQACHNLYEWRRRYRARGGERDFAMSLQIHDALLFEVPVADVAWFVDEVLVRCMRDWVDIWPRDFDGVPLPGVDAPYHLDVDVEAFTYWGVKLGRDEGLALGLPESTPAGRRLLPEPKAR